MKRLRRLSLLLGPLMVVLMLANIVAGISPVEAARSTGSSIGKASGLQTAGTCPTDASAITSMSVRITRGGNTINQSNLAGIQSGDTVKVTFDLDDDCSNYRVSLVSYKAPDATNNLDSLSLRVVNSQNTNLFGSSGGSLTVSVPNCYHATVLAVGSVLTTMNATTTYGSRQKDTGNGGSATCSGMGTPSPRWFSGTSTNCATAGALYGETWAEYVVNSAPANTTYTLASGGHKVTVSGASSTAFNWTSTGTALKGVLLKSSGGTNLYRWASGSFSGSGMKSVGKPDGSMFSITSAAFCFAPIPTTSVCPEGKAAMTAYRFEIWRGGTKINATDLNNLQSGDLVKAFFDLAPGCVNIELSMASYTAPESYYDVNTVHLQVYQPYTGDTGLFSASQSASERMLQSLVPSCFFQTDFVFGPVIEQLTPSNLYGNAKIAWKNGGSTVCGTTRIIPTSTNTPNATTTRQAEQTATKIAEQTGTSVSKTQTAIAPPTQTAVSKTQTAVAGTATSVSKTQTVVANQTGTSVAKTATVGAGQTSTAVVITQTAVVQQTGTAVVKTATAGANQTATTTAATGTSVAKTATTSAQQTGTSVASTATSAAATGTVVAQQTGTTTAATATASANKTGTVVAGTATSSAATATTAANQTATSAALTVTAQPAITQTAVAKITQTAGANQTGTAVVTGSQTAVAATATNHANQTATSVAGTATSTVKTATTVAEQTGTSVAGTATSTVKTATTVANQTGTAVVVSQTAAAATSTHIAGVTQTAVSNTQTAIAVTETAVAAVTETFEANQTATEEAIQTSTAEFEETETAIAGITETFVAGVTGTAASITETVIANATGTAEAATVTHEANETATSESITATVISETSTAEAEITATYTAGLPGSLAIHKTDQDGLDLVGACFWIYGPASSVDPLGWVCDNNLVPGEFDQMSEPQIQDVNDTQGWLLVRNLTPTNGAGAPYLVEEAYAPVDYDGDWRQHPVHVYGNNTSIQTVEIMNEYNGNPPGSTVFMYKVVCDTPADHAEFDMEAFITMGILPQGCELGFDGTTWTFNLDDPQSNWQKSVTIGPDGIAEVFVDSSVLSVQVIETGMSNPLLQVPEGGLPPTLGGDIHCACNANDIVVFNYRVPQAEPTNTPQP